MRGWILASLTLTTGLLLAGCDVGGTSSNTPTAPPRPTYVPPAAGATTIVASNSPVRRGSVETIEALAAPGATCKLRVSDHTGTTITIPINETRPTSPHGTVVWAWTVAASTPPGTLEASVSCVPGKTSTTHFAVT
jgi:hypothetical protein